MSAGRCSSPPTTASTARSCGSRTAPGRARSWSRTSTAADDDYDYGPHHLTGVGRDVVLHRRRRHPRPELWKSDGTKAGTVLVKDITPGRRYDSYSSDSLTGVGRDVVLHRQRRHPRPRAVEVGRHQGGHRPGQGHQPGRLGSYPVLPDRCGRDVVLRRRRRHPRPELWKSDGTEAGTVLVKDINAGGAFSVASKGRPTPARAR